MWHDILKHAHWIPELTTLGAAALQRTFDLVPSASAAVPPFIALHARHGDFAQYCSDAPDSKCFASLSAFDRRVREVQDELEARTGVRPTQVIMTGDETDEGWWDEVAARGWHRLDYTAGADAAGDLGSWYPVLLDAVVQSMAVGFVGTEDSTFSIVAQRRVVDWNDGAARMVGRNAEGTDQN